jgi:hypothetical protein
MTSSFHSGRRVTALLLALSLVSGCVQRVPSTPAPTRAARPAAQPTLAAADQQTVDQAWAGLLKLYAIYIKAAQTGVYDWNADATKRPLYAYAGGPYMSALERDLDLMQEQGFVRTGTPKLTLRRVVSVSQTSIVVEACVDDTGTDTVKKETGKSVVKAGQNQRYPVTLRAGLYPDGKWRWVDSRPERASSC